MARAARRAPASRTSTPNLPTNIVDFRRFDSSVILISTGGIPRLIRDFPEGLSQAISAGIRLVGRLGVRVFRSSRNVLAQSLDDVGMALLVSIVVFCNIVPMALLYCLL